MAQNLLQVKDGSKSYGSRYLFEGASFSIDHGEHVGVIGPNGAGKSTLFKILLNQDSFDSGELALARGVRLGYLPQHDDWDLNETVDSYVAKNAHMESWELRALGRGLGLEDEMFERPMNSFSGGYRMRAKLLSLLGQAPDLMMLDEPTNYLDLDSLLVLENFLQDYRGAFLLISHDREFLRRTTDHILEVEGGDIVKYNGNLDDYFEQKAMLREQLEARAMSLAQKRKEVLDFVARFGAKASKAAQAQSRLKSLNRMETIEVKALPVSARVRIPAPTHCGKDVLTVRNVDLGYGEKVVLRDLNFEIRNGDHLAVVGVNGAGKTTFLKALSGELSPLSGAITLGYQVSLGYYAQHVAESLDPRDNVIEAMGEWAQSGVSTQDVKDMAGSLLFSGDNALKKIAVLSGGERSRVALGRILLKRAPCLILDEPTNHLDFQSVEALTIALQNYEGTVIIVSHDRSFTGRVGRKILEIRAGQGTLFPGSYDDYVWSLQKGALAKRQEKAKAAEPAPAPRPVVAVPAALSPEAFEIRKAQQRESFRLQRDSEGLEKNSAQLESELTKLNVKLQETPPGGEAHRALLFELGEKDRKKAQIEEQWMQVLARLEEVKAALG